jgi:glutamyl-tRNA synthetase
MDALEGITYRIRTKEFELRNELHNYIQETLGFDETKIFEVARFNLKGVPSSGRIIREKLQKKELIGWDDPSLTTISALKRRGFKAEVIKEFVLNTGISKAESELDWDDLIIQNKRVLDKEAKRYFFIQEPKKIEIKNSPKLNVDVQYNQENKKLGSRKFMINNEFYVMDKLEKNKVYRLMHLFNFKNNEFISKDLDKSLNAKLIHWLPYSKDLIKIEILMPDKKIIKGLAEKEIKKLKINEIIQFVRFGFVRLDKKDKNKLVFWFTHK